MKKNLVVIMRSLPGGGKTTYVNEKYPLAVACSADHFFTQDGVYTFVPALIGKAHAECLRKFILALIDQAPIIVVDNTNSQLWEYQNYVLLAQMHGYEVQIVQIDHSGKADTFFQRQTHGVPEGSFKAMLSRWEHDERAVVI